MEWSENHDSLEKITERGCAFVRSNFNGPKVAENLFREIAKIRDEK